MTIPVNSSAPRAWGTGCGSRAAIRQNQPGSPAWEKTSLTKRETVSPSVLASSARCCRSWITRSSVKSSWVKTGSKCFGTSSTGSGGALSIRMYSTSIRRQSVMIPVSSPAASATPSMSARTIRLSPARSVMRRRILLLIPAIAVLAPVSVASDSAYPSTSSQPGLLSVVPSLSSPAGVT
ncbi:DUF6527 family protein [Sorangium sp. So ce1128]